MKPSHITLHRHFSSSAWQPFLVQVRTIREVNPPSSINSEDGGGQLWVGGNDGYTTIRETPEQVAALIDGGAA